MLTGGFRIDAIKRSAHRAAWFNSGSDPVRTYNIFGRIDTRPKKHHDVENQVIHPATENDLISPIEDERRVTAAAENHHFTPARAHTLPANPTPRLDIPQRPQREFPAEDEKQGHSIESKEPDGTIEQTITSTSTANGSRKRRSRRRFFDKFTPKHETDSDRDLAHVDEEDNKKDTPKLTIASQLKAVFISPINVLLVFVPVGIALNYAGVNRIIVFVMNFLAIIPLAAILSFSTEELALYVGEVLGGLLNASFGNAVELIVSIIALIERETLIVQTSLVGSMLSNLLLVLGMCMAGGGLKRKEQHFNITVAQTAASLLALAIGSLIIPTAFQHFESEPGGVTQTSRGTAVILLIVYGCYLLFQLRTHVDMYNAPSEKSPKSSSGKKEAGEANLALAAMAGTGAATGGGEVYRENIQPEQDEREVPQLTKFFALGTLAVSTVFIALCAEFMVKSIGALAAHVSPEFIGLILLPIVGNAAEHATAVTVAIKDKMDLAIGVAVGSSLQIALLILPIMILLNWFGLGAPADLTLDFDGFQVSCLFIAIIIVNYVVQDGKSNWLEGVMLQATYIIIAVSAWFYKTSGVVAG